MRPEKAIEQDKLNEAPPHIVVSLRFNNRQQDCMTTLCGGNILPDELDEEEMRASFIVSAVTGKHVHSANLGAWITKCCELTLGVKPLNWQDSIEDNAKPVVTAALDNYLFELETNDGFYNGVVMSNPVLNGIFAQSVVIPFPDMQWVQAQCVNGVDNWIERYTASVTEAIVRHVDQNIKNYR